VTTVNAEGQVFSQASRSRQPVLVVTMLIIYSTDRWNPIDIVMLTKRTITKRIIINKFYKVFKTQAT
jgi:hypothetical protein